jgi:exodeoxyribonuclease VII small subunit
MKIEEQLLRLSDIVQQVESGDTPLEAAIELYKEGLALAEECATRLTGFETEIEILSQDITGEDAS